MTALTRDALIAYRASLPSHSRGIRVLDELARRLTNEELRMELELERVVDDAIRAEMEECREGM
jgi:hypothetical protein